MSMHRVHDPARYPLSPDSLLVDAGGFMGDWSARAANLYRPTIHIFEPVPEYAALCRERFDEDERIAIHEAALAPATGLAAMTVDGDASSAAHGGPLVVHTIGVADFFADLVRPVTLMKVNIEGGEYDLLDAMHAHGLLAQVDHLAIQFHGNVPDYERRWAANALALEFTHDLAYRDPFVWERWDRRA